MMKIFHISQWKWWVKTLVGIILALAILSGVIFARVQYSKRYFEGMVQTYINAQQIPKNKIKLDQIYLHLKTGRWMADYTVYAKGKKYRYEYMGFEHEVTLSIYNDNNDYIENAKQMPYPILKYDVAPPVDSDHYKIIEYK